jgi:hypothetical protein
VAADVAPTLSPAVAVAMAAEELRWWGGEGVGHNPPARCGGGGRRHFGCSIGRVLEILLLMAVRFRVYMYTR